MLLHVQPDRVLSFEMAQELRIEIECIEAVHGTNVYSEYLRKYGRRPDPPTAATIGTILGGRVKASDGSMQPRRKAHR
ncbi:MAG: hypothetical protein WBQ17_12275 [Rhizomicrobium sp.]